MRSFSPARFSRSHMRVCALVLALLASLIVVLTGCGGTAKSQSVTVPTPTATPKSSVRYVALGASDAVGVGATPATSYVADIIAKLPPGSFALNLGVSGIELHDALTQELPQALAAHPTFVTIWLTANDFKGCVSLAQYTTDLNSLLGQVQSKTQAQVFIANLPDLTQLPAFQNKSALGPCLLVESNAQIKAQIAQWNAVIAQAASAHGATLVDLSTGALSSNPDYISTDGFHPSATGYAALAGLFWEEITAHHAVPTN